jgi:PAS domain S-box-containing protein
MPESLCRDRNRTTDDIGGTVRNSASADGDPGSVVVVGDADAEDALRDDELPVTAVEDADALLAEAFPDATAGASEDDPTIAEMDDAATADDDPACIVVAGVPPDWVRDAVAEHAPGTPILAFAEAPPEDVAGRADDYVPRTGDAVDRLTDRVRWHAAGGPPADGAGADDDSTAAAGAAGTAAARDGQREKIEQLHDIATELLACREESTVYELVVAAAERILAFDICGVDAVEDGWLVPKAVSTGMADTGYRRVEVEDGGLAGRAVRTGDPILVDDVRESSVADPADDEYRSVLTVPIGERGVFQAGSREVGAFDGADLELAELLAAHAAGTLHRIRSEQAIHRRRETIERLHDVAADLVASRTEAELYERLVEASSSVLRFDGSVVMDDHGDGTDDCGNVLYVRAASEEALAPESDTWPVDRGIAGRTYRTGEAVVIDDMTERGSADPDDEQFRAGLSVPIGERGVFQAVSTEPGSFDESDLELAELLVAHAEGTLHRIRSERAAHRRRETIERLHGIAANLMASESEAELCELLVEAADRVLDFEVSVALTDLAGGERLRVRAVSDDELAPPVGDELPADEGVGGRTYATGEAVVVDEVADSDLAEPHDDSYRSAISVPMGDLGVFQAISTEPDAFGESDLELAELLVAHAGVVVRRLRAESRLVAERDRLVALFQNIPDPAISTTFEDDEPVVLDVNDAFEETFGYGAETAAGEPIDELIVPEDAREEAAAFNERVRRGETTRATARRRTAEGDLRDFLVHLVPVESGAETVGFAIYTDITARRRRERAVTRLHRATRDLVAADSREEVARITTRAARGVLGFELSGVRLLEDGTLHPTAVTDERIELLGNPPPYDVGSDAPAAAAYRSESMLVFDEGADADDRQDRTPLEAAVYLPLGDHGTLSVATTRTTAVPDADRVLLQILAGNTTVALDRLEQERRASERKRELERQNERLDDFASVVSHDLRNPLSVARGHLKLARDAGRKDSLERVADAHERMDRLIDDLLTLARQGQVVGETEPADLERLAHEAWATVETTDATLSVRDVGTVEADPDRAVQLYENLFRNSVEHAGPDVEIEVGATGDGFYVADDGPGIPSEERERVLEHGYTTADDGTGFGLAIVVDIAEAHGWDVDVTESDEGGARFEITGVDPADGT